MRALAEMLTPERAERPVSTIMIDRNRRQPRTQITTTLIRAMGVEGIRLRDLGRVIVKKLGAGTLLGVSMAVLGVGGPIIVTVVATLACICVWSSLIASLLPMLLRRIGVDPAVVSAPRISTIVDGTGLMIYFLLAKAIVL